MKGALRYPLAGADPARTFDAYGWRTRRALAQQANARGDPCAAAGILQWIRIGGPRAARGGPVERWWQGMLDAFDGLLSRAGAL
jgi:hypothetical protein